MKKLIMITSALLLLYGFLTPTPVLPAEVKEIIVEGTYTMGDGETPIIAESRAVEQAKRQAVEQAGTFVKSYSRVKNFQLAEDEIEVLASGMMEIIILDKKRALEADAVKFWVRIKAVVKPDKIEVIAERVKEQGLGEEYMKIKAAYDQSQEEVARLKKQLTATKAEPERREIIGRIGAQEKAFRSRQFYANAVKDFAAGRMDEAMELITRSIAENPEFSAPLVLRGWVYYKRADYDQAFSDFDKAVALVPTSAKAYAGRGMCHSRKRRCDAAIADLTKSLQIDPNPPQELRVGIYNHLEGCILHDAWEYYKQADYDKAFLDFEKAIELMPTSAKAYAGRGMCHSRKSRCDAAIADLTKSLQIDPNPPQELKIGIHAHLGRCLLQEGDRLPAKHHLEIACKLGAQEACKTLQSPRLRDLR